MAGTATSVVNYPDCVVNVQPFDAAASDAAHGQLMETSRVRHGYRVEQSIQRR
jgi:hypothetical protein